MPRKKEESKALTPYQKKVKTVKELILAHKKEIEEAGTKAVPWSYFNRVLWTAIRSNPELLECTGESLIGSIIQAQTMGLSLNPLLRQCALVPRKIKGTKKAQLEVMYAGYVELMTRTGEVMKVDAQTVFEKDHFEIEYGTEEKLVHKPHINGDRGEPIGAYAVATFSNGFKKIHWMPKDQIEKARKVSAAGDKGPWGEWVEEMYRKTPTKNLAKYVRLETLEMQMAVGMDNALEAGVDQHADVILDEENIELPDPQAATEKTMEKLKEDMAESTPHVEDDDFKGLAELKAEKLGFSRVLFRAFAKTVNGATTYEDLPKEFFEQILVMPAEEIKKALEDFRDAKVPENQTEPEQGTLA
jgi:recombination protein RecT